MSAASRGAGVPLSILDLSPVSAGSTPQQAIRNTIDLARHAESWGYRRFWIAEHHFVPPPQPTDREPQPAELILAIGIGSAHIKNQVGMESIERTSHR